MRTRIKICGLTRETDVQSALASGADALGFVFYPNSPRYVTWEQAKVLMSHIPPFVTIVGLFVNAEPAFIETALARLPIQLLQFHGDETAAACAIYRRPYIKAIRMKPGISLLDEAQSFAGAQALLLDAFVDGYGGAGQVFDWTLIPPALPSQIVLSGGLNAANVPTAIRQVQPWGVDVSSGVEVPGQKGIKDPERIREFCQAVRLTDQGVV